MMTRSWTLKLAPCALIATLLVACSEPEQESQNQAVINGTPTSAGSAVMIAVGVAPNFAPGCSGSLIAPQWVLTRASASKPEEIRWLVCRVGTSRPRQRVDVS